MLFVGIDWAEAEHTACLLAPSGAVLRRLRVPHSAAGVRRLRAAIAAEAPAPGAVHVALERSHGLLVDGLREAGYVVYGLNPKAVERYRDRTRTAKPAGPACPTLPGTALGSDSANIRGQRARECGGRTGRRRPCTTIAAPRPLAQSDPRTHKPLVGSSNLPPATNQTQNRRSPCLPQAG